jgi:hypothetical protein
MTQLYSWHLSQLFPNETRICVASSGGHLVMYVTRCHIDRWRKRTPDISLNFSRVAPVKRNIRRWHVRGGGQPLQEKELPTRCTCLLSRDAAQLVYYWRFGTAYRSNPEGSSLNLQDWTDTLSCQLHQATSPKTECLRQLQTLNFILKLSLHTDSHVCVSRKRVKSLDMNLKVQYICTRTSFLVFL